MKYEQGPISRTIFHRYSNSTKKSFCSYPSCCEVPAIKFFTWHDSCAIMACARFYSDMILHNGVTLKTVFHRIWISMEKSFVKWAPGLCCPLICCVFSIFNGFMRPIYPCSSGLLYRHHSASDVTRKNITFIKRLNHKQSINCTLSKIRKNIYRSDVQLLSSITLRFLQVLCSK